MASNIKRKNNFAIVMRCLREFLTYFVLFFTLIVGAASCSEKGEPVVLKDSDYFPLKKGSYQIYTVEETQIDQINTVKLNYEIRQEVTDSLPNLSGSYTYVITRSKRNSATETWTAFDTWSARIDSRQLVVSEENIPYVKLAFPLTEGKIWNGNSLNTLGGDERCGTAQSACDNYTLEKVNANNEIKVGLTFAETVTVNQNNNTDVIVSQDVRKEVYARNVGLINKETSILQYCTTPTCLGKQLVNKGYIYKQVIKEYGGY